MKPRRRKPQEPLGLQLFQSPPSDEHGLPLDELTQAYAELIARGDDPYTPVPDPEAGPAAILADEDPDEGEESATTMRRTAANRLSRAIARPSARSRRVRSWRRCCLSGIRRTSR